MRHFSTAVALLAATVLFVGCGRGDRSAAGRGAHTAAQAQPAQPALATRARSVPQLRFEEYAVTDTFLGRRQPAEVRLGSAPYGRMYRTKLREGAARGPNFAGRFTVVLWGCGTGCQIVAVVDARTGRLSRQTLLTASGVEYRRDSRLLLADARTPEIPDNCASCGTPAYYEWRGDRFEPVGPGPHPHPRGPRPWQTWCAPTDTGANAATGLYTCPRPAR